MNVSGRVVQAFLKSYDFWGDGGPLVLDGIIGPNTYAALWSFDQWVAGNEENARLWGDYSIVPTADNRSLVITPDAVANRIRSRGEAYLAEHPEEIVFPRTAAERAPAPAPATIETESSIVVAIPFWSWRNPWAWFLAGAGFLGLSGLTFLYVSRKGVR